MSMGWHRDLCEMGASPICLSLGLGLGPVETLPNIIIKPNSLFHSIGLGLGMGIGQCIQAIRVSSHLTTTTTMCFFLSSCVNSYIDDNATHP